MEAVCLGAPSSPSGFADRKDRESFAIFMVRGQAGDMSTHSGFNSCFAMFGKV